MGRLDSLPLVGLAALGLGRLVCVGLLGTAFVVDEEERAVERHSLVEPPAVVNHVSWLGDGSIVAGLETGEVALFRVPARGARGSTRFNKSWG